MTDATHPPANLTLTANQVANHLSKSLGQTVTHWQTWLANDRKPNRVNRRLPIESGVGRPRYNAGIVDAFVTDLLNEENQAVNSGRNTRASGGSKFAAHISPMTVDGDTSQQAVLLVIAKPLATFMLTADEARNIARRLNQAADDLDMNAAES